VQKKDYLEADYYAQLIKQSQKATDVSNFSSLCTQKLEYYMEKQADAQGKVDETNREWENTFKEFEEMVDDKMQKLADAQNEELDEFDAKAPADLPVEYRKHSVRYVLLRKQEKLLLRNEEFVVANAVKERADALEAEELSSQHMKLQDDLQQKRNAIIAKHTQQFEAFALWLNARRHEMVRERERDLEGPIRRLDHYTKLVEVIEKKGMPPNPYDGFTKNRVSRRESVKALRMAAQKPRERAESRPRERQPIPRFRPTSAMYMTGRSGRSGSRA
jgi:hypothetical protein